MVLPPKNDPATGKPVQIIIDSSTKLLKDNEVIKLVKPEEPAPSEGGEEEPKPEDDPPADAEKKTEEAEAQTGAETEGEAAAEGENEAETEGETEAAVEGETKTEAEGETEDQP